MTIATWELAPERLRWECDHRAFSFECTDEISPAQGFIGQDRALKSIEFGLQIAKPGFNLFVTGLTGTGKRSVIQHYVELHVRRLREAGAAPPAYDWLYVHNFRDSDRPSVLRVPHDHGRELAHEMEDLADEVRVRLAQAFASEEYLQQRQAIAQAAEEQSQGLIGNLEQQARRTGLGIQFTPQGVAVFPLLNDKPMTPEEFNLLPPENQQRIEGQRRALMGRVEEVTLQVQELGRRATEQVRELDQKTGEYHITMVFGPHLVQHREEPQVLAFVEHLRDYTKENVEAFRKAVEAAPPVRPPTTNSHPLPSVPTPTQIAERAADPFRPFQVNVFVDNSDTTTPPIVVETNPTWTNLFGRIERRAIFGAYVSDHTLLKPGSLHRANGGYLIMDAKDVLTNPSVWEGLKRAARNREVRLEDPAEQLGFVPPQGLRPEPVPLQVKVVLLGDEQLYRALSIADHEDFWELFKVKAEFDSVMDRTKESVEAFASFICGISSSEGIRPFERAAVAKVVEYASRMVDDQRRLSARFGQVRDLLLEADHWAGRADSRRVKVEHVAQAWQERFARMDLVRRHLRRAITDGTIRVDMTGVVVGQVNALVVYDLGDLQFGMPVRLTAQTFAGRRGVVNIEREVHLSGPIHDKGVLTLGGYLGWKFAQDRPLSLSVSVTFEQSYGGVDGDSASSTELYAILSSLADAPIRQGVAVTGSVDQFGRVQPIGGINEKIEGFFDVCVAKGLTGDQGVLVPATNVLNLMLREDVVQAVREGKFHVWAVETIDQGIEVLTGVRAGAQRADGSYPRGTINARAQKRLGQYAASMRGYYFPGGNGVETEAEEGAQEG